MNSTSSQVANGGVRGLSKSWKPTVSHAGVYTGGKVEFSASGEFLACFLHEDVAFLEASTGELRQTLQKDVEEEEEKESIISFALHPNNKQIATASRNLLIRLWDIETRTCIKTMKAHDTPVLCMDFHSSGKFLATGGSDRTVKVFDMENGYCTHNFRGHTGIVTAVKFHSDEEKLLLVSASDDSSVRIWDLYSQKNVANLTDHVSPVTSVDFSEDGWTMISAGRDKVVNFWDLRKYSLLKTLPVFEAVEGVCVVPQAFNVDKAVKTKKQKGKARNINFVVAGDKGTLRLWSFTPGSDKSSSGSCEQLLEKKATTSALHFSNVLINKARQEFLAVTTEQNFLIFDNLLNRIKQIVGYNDDIIAIKAIPQIPRSDDITQDLPHENRKECEIAVATNSEQIRILSRATFTCEFLSGHTDIVMSLDVSPDGRWLTSVSKDKSARVWNLRTQQCIAVCEGHTDALGAVGISQKLSSYSIGQAFFVTGSADKTIKLWSLKDLSGIYTQKETANESQLTINPPMLAAIKAHDRDINSISVSPNDRLIASASQDKTVKLWSYPDLKLIGTCRGHKRGVWAVEFSPVDQCFATASGDKTVKIWSAKDFSCLKTFEGHTASVLNVQFLSAGMQLVSSGADGLAKVWTIKSNECETTLDNHVDKIWALAVCPDFNNNEKDEILSGGGDSMINIWTDFTEEEDEKLALERETIVLKEQELFNCLREDKLLDAVKIAFDLGHPNRLLGILKQILEGPKSKDFADDSAAAESSFDLVVKELDNDQLTVLLSWVKDWNTNAKNCRIAQLLISSVLRNIPPQKLRSVNKISSTLDAILAYSERHFDRMERMIQKSFLLDYSVVSMKQLLSVKEHAVPALKVDEPSQTIENVGPIEDELSQKVENLEPKEDAIADIEKIDDIESSKNKKKSPKGSANGRKKRKADRAVDNNEAISAKKKKSNGKKKKKD